MSVRRVEAVAVRPESPAPLQGRHGDTLVGLLSSGPHHQGHRPALLIRAEDIHADTAGEMDHLVLGTVNLAFQLVPAKAENSLDRQGPYLPVELVTRPRRVNEFGDAEELDVADLGLLPPDAAGPPEAGGDRLAPGGPSTLRRSLWLSQAPYSSLPSCGIAAPVVQLLNKMPISGSTAGAGFKGADQVSQRDPGAILAAFRTDAGLRVRRPVLQAVRQETGAGQVEQLVGALPEFSL